MELPLGLLRDLPLLRVRAQERALRGAIAVEVALGRQIDAVVGDAVKEILLHQGRRAAVLLLSKCQGLLRVGDYQQFLVLGNGFVFRVVESLGRELKLVPVPPAVPDEVGISVSNAIAPTSTCLHDCADAATQACRLQGRNTGPWPAVGLPSHRTGKEDADVGVRLRPLGLLSILHH
eukprot:11785583-Alexandrium_andersonii.AAC.1